MLVRVLVAEDEWLIATALCRQVESHGHQVVAVVGTGAAALASSREQRPDVVLMDVQMPEMDGLTATRKLMEVCPQPVIIVTGNARLRDAAEQAGAMDFVVKPLLTHQIPEVIARARRRFEWFMALHREAADCAAAMAAWPTVLAAVRQVVRAEGICEEEAFGRLWWSAGGQGCQLEAAAKQALSDTQPQ